MVRQPEFDEVRLDVGTDHVAVLTIDAPERRNALTPDLVDALIGAVEHLRQLENARALVIASSGSAFCAGAALGQLDAADERVLRHIYEAFLRIKSLEIPTVAAVGGAAVGAGLNLAMACDLRVTSPAAVFDSRFVKIGLHPGGGATWLLRAAAGQSLATAMLLFDQRITGEEAVARGLSWACVSDEDLLPEAHRLAASAARAPLELTALVKQSLADTMDLTHPDALELELKRQVWTTTQPWYASARSTSSTAQTEKG